MANGLTDRRAAEAAMKGLKSFALYMLADFALIAGVVLMLFGVGEYLSKVIGIPGAGNVALGLALILIGTVVLSQSKARVQIGMQPPMPPAAPPEMPPPDAGTYR